MIYAAGSCYNGSATVMAICKSTDGGANWSRYEISTSQGEVYTLVMHPTDPNILLVGGYFVENYVGKVLKSTDGGVNWSDASSGLSANYNYVYALAIDPKAPQTMYAGCNNGIFKSTDSGTSWSNLNVPFGSICEVIISSQMPPTIYAASSYAGIYCSVDGGRNWTAMNEGLTTLQIECLALDPVNHLLYAGTNGGGVFRRDISTGVEPIRPPAEAQSQFVLKANYPNPFNQGTTISYEVPSSWNSPIQLRIYNVAGQLMKTLFDDIQPAGSYTIHWDGLDNRGIPVSSGVYLCILQAGKFRVSRKITLIR